MKNGATLSRKVTGPIVIERNILNAIFGSNSHKVLPILFQEIDRLYYDRIVQTLQIENGFGSYLDQAFHSTQKFQRGKDSRIGKSQGKESCSFAEKIATAE